MEIRERLKNEVMTERQKLKNMSLKDQVWYIWEYYKFYILGVLIVIGIFWVIGTTIYRSTFDSALYCMYINNRSEGELNTDVLTKDFHDYMGFTDKQLIHTESTFLSYGDNTSEYSYASMAKISALVASNELDMMIGDEENFDHYAAMGAYADLEELLPAQLLDTVKDRLVYTTDESGASKAFGVTVDGTKFAEESNLTLSPAILGVIRNSGNTDNCIALIRYIFAR